MEKITEELINGGMSGSGGWNKKQVELIWLKWPLTHGWKQRVIGKPISRLDALKFLELKGKTIKTIKPSRQRQSELPLADDCPRDAARTVTSFWAWLDRQPFSTRKRVNDALIYIVRKNHQSIQEPVKP